MEESQKRVKFCPKCGSPDVTFAVFFKPSIWKCLDCGYEGAFIVEDSDLTQNIKEKSAYALEERGIEVPGFTDTTAAWYMPPQAES